MLRKGIESTEVDQSKCRRSCEMLYTWAWSGYNHIDGERRGDGGCQGAATNSLSELPQASAVIVSPVDANAKFAT